MDVNKYQLSKIDRQITIQPLLCSWVSRRVGILHYHNGAMHQMITADKTELEGLRPIIRAHTTDKVRVTPTLWPNNIEQSIYRIPTITQTASCTQTYRLHHVSKVEKCIEKALTWSSHPTWHSLRNFTNVSTSMYLWPATEFSFFIVRIKE